MELSRKEIKKFTQGPLQGSLFSKKKIIAFILDLRRIWDPASLLQISWIPVLCLL
jgi:hypothetical protein